MGISLKLLMVWQPSLLRYFRTWLAFAFTVKESILWLIQEISMSRNGKVGDLMMVKVLLMVVVLIFPLVSCHISVVNYILLLFNSSSTLI